MAATVYWLSFRLKDSDGYERTYDNRLAKINAEVHASCGTDPLWWYETSSFYIFRSAESIDTIVARVRRAIDEDVDIVVVRQLDSKVGRVIGNCEDEDIFKLAPYMKKV